MANLPRVAILKAAALMAEFYDDENQPNTQEAVEEYMLKNFGHMTIWEIETAMKIVEVTSHMVEEKYGAPCPVN